METAFTAHRRLGDIHPFNDGVGRTARLLMNLVLIRAGHPPIAVRLDATSADYLSVFQRAPATRG
jgi:Fic family protein